MEGRCSLVLWDTTHIHTQIIYTHQISYIIDHTPCNIYITHPQAPLSTPATQPKRGAEVQPIQRAATAATPTTSGQQCGTGRPLAQARQSRGSQATPASQLPCQSPRLQQQASSSTAITTANNHHHHHHSFIVSSDRLADQRATINWLE